MKKNDLREGNFVLFPCNGSYVEVKLLSIGDIAYTEINNSFQGVDIFKLRPIFLDDWWKNKVLREDLTLFEGAKTVHGAQNFYYFLNKKELDFSRVPMRGGIVLERNLKLNFR